MAADPLAADVQPENDAMASVHPVTRPEFLADYPDAPELRPLISAFVAGNYRKLRELASALEVPGTDPEVLGCARELVARTEADPTAKWLLVLSLAFLSFLVLWVYFIHGH
jgi:hypothetical protein